MKEFPALSAPNRLKSLLGKIGSLGVPESKVDGAWLSSVGFGNSNDRSIPKVLEFIDFIDSSRLPTDNWTDFRIKRKSGSVIATAIMKGYAELYKVHPKAHQCTDDDLKDFFRGQSNADNNKVTRMLRTFKTLCSLADFGQTGESEDVSEEQVAIEPAIVRPLPSHAAKQSSTPSLHIDVQIHIPSDASPEQIDKIFASMAKHLYNNTDDVP